MSVRHSNLERILGRIDDLDATNLTVLVQLLVRERGLLTTILNTIRDGVLVIDNNGVIEYANDTGRDLIGIKEEDIGKAVLWKWMPDITNSLDIGLSHLGKLDTTISRELEITYPEYRFVRFYMTPFSDPREHKEEPLHTVILSDITEEKISTEEMIENEKVSSIMMLAAGVAHELGNPLNALNIHLQIISRQLGKLDDSPASQKIREAIDVCGKETERLDSIVTHFLDAIRPREPEFKSIALVELLEEVLNFLEEEINNLNISTEIIVKTNYPRVEADPNQIKQVFFNVCKNAMEAMDAGGELKITCYEDESHVYLAFADTGVGIDQETVSRIFEPYYSTKKTGHGLGMMVCQRIMRDHYGQIGIDSRKGSGTVVTLQFPHNHRRVRMLETSQNTQA